MKYRQGLVPVVSFQFGCGSNLVKYLDSLGSKYLANIDLDLLNIYLKLI